MPKWWVSRLTAPATFEDTLDAEVRLLMAILVPMDRVLFVPLFTSLDFRQYKSLMRRNN